LNEDDKEAIKKRRHTRVVEENFNKNVNETIVKNEDHRKAPRTQKIEIDTREYNMNDVKTRRDDTTNKNHDE